MILGIDLGTSNSLSSTLSNDFEPVLVPDQALRDTFITPSVVSIESNRALVGQLAESYQELNPNRSLIRYFKRFFGTQKPIFFDERGSPWFSESVAALVLKKLKFDAEVFGAATIEQLIVTVPSHYNDAQRRSVIEAAKLADIKLGAIIDEPVAAALSYHVKSRQHNQVMLVYDFGGGTLDLTLITRDAQKVHILAKDGVANLGGKEFDEVISQRIASDYRKAFGQEIEWDQATTNKVMRYAEQIKIELSGAPAKEFTKWIVINGHAMEFTLELMQVASPLQRLIDQSEAAVNRCLRSSGLTFDDLDKVLLVGGTSQFPMIREFWEKKLVSRNKKAEYFDPLHAVALGAAIYAQSLMGGTARPIDLKSCSSHNIFVREHDGGKGGGWEVAILKNSPLPVTGKRAFRFHSNGTNVFSLELGQSLDRDDNINPMGILKAERTGTLGILNLELQIENRANGTLAIKLFNGDNSKEIRFAFEKAVAEHSYDFHQQKKLVESTLINNIVS